MRYYKTYVSDMYMSKLELPENIKKVGFSDGDVVNAGYKEVLDLVLSMYFQSE